MNSILLAENWPYTSNLIQLARICRLTYECDITCLPQFNVQYRCSFTDYELDQIEARNPCLLLQVTGLIVCIEINNTAWVVPQRITYSPQSAYGIKLAPIHMQACTVTFCMQKASCDEGLFRYGRGGFYNHCTKDYLLKIAIFFIVFAHQRCTEYKGWFLFTLTVENVKKNCEIVIWITNIRFLYDIWWKVNVNYF